MCQKCGQNWIKIFKMQKKRVPDLQNWDFYFSKFKTKPFMAKQEPACYMAYFSVVTIGLTWLFLVGRQFNTALTIFFPIQSTILFSLPHFSSHAVRLHPTLPSRPLQLCRPRSHPQGRRLGASNAINDGIRGRWALRDHSAARGWAHPENWVQNPAEKNLQGREDSSWEVRPLEDVFWRF